MDEDERILGECSPAEIVAYLREIGDEERAVRLERQAARPRGQGLGAYFGQDQYLYKGLVVGFIPGGGSDRGAILDANAIDPETDLKGRRLKVTLDQFFVQAYPGNGTHRILCEFAGQNQIADDTEELKFTLMVEAADGQPTGVVGKPIFMGLTIGDDGLNFRGQTVNVGNDTDDLILDALNGEAFKSGLTLATTLQPALKPFVGLATSVVKATIKRSRNKPVFKFDVGLDFNARNLSARLRRGSYVVVQCNDEEWDWSRFEFAAETRRVIRKSDGRSLALNYFVIGIDDFAGEPAKPATRTRSRQRSSITA
ncbi:hypothetical protein [Methylobacterium brachiatum]|uniref:hypothetical protein n=1 Tax=Methylobacterium brachiatum TaxID=269660 RepID=UPI00244B5E31|nr:hypothetical protein [Methylobacterium brachiatum]MDH2313493.1 hypothetical protein [Methylobacterium brachiatum]